VRFILAHNKQRVCHEFFRCTTKKKRTTNPLFVTRFISVHDKQRVRCALFQDARQTREFAVCFCTVNYFFQRPLATVSIEGGVCVCRASWTLGALVVHRGPWRTCICCALRTRQSYFSIYILLSPESNYPSQKSLHLETFLHCIYNM
jgi:hypothetical protein